MGEPMIHDTMLESSTSAARRGLAPAAGPILACTSGDDATDAVLRTARRLSADSAHGVRVLAALEPLPIGAIGFEVIPQPVDTEEERRNALLGTVREHLLATIGTDAVWGVEVRNGQPARAIANAAKEHGASLIVMGLGRHAILDRLLGTETALHAMRAARTPVLAVPAGATGTMKSAIVAMDFGAAAISAARAAVQCLQRPATMTLVHVMPRMDTPPFLTVEFDETYRSELPTLFARTIEAIGAPEDIAMDTVTLYGDPSVEILAYARHRRADLIALGRRGLGAFERLLVGSVTTRVLRGSTCAVLTTPVPDAARSDEIDRVLTRQITSEEPARWESRLGEFTSRNVGRLTHIEVDDPAFGAQSQETGYPLRGITYDRHDRRIAIMLGADSIDGPHLTRSIAEVSGISILNDERSRDQALRIAHGDGQTILSFAD